MRNHQVKSVSLREVDHLLHHHGLVGFDGCFEAVLHCLFQFIWDARSIGEGLEAVILEKIHQGLGVRHLRGM